MKALLIIDMQKVSFSPKTLRYDTVGVIKRINELSDRFRLNGDLVIYIQHDGSKEDYCYPDTDEWKILPDLIIHPNDLIISKTANDSFYKSLFKIF
jgi:nicotinamidase-related amidase